MASLTSVLTYSSGTAREPCSSDRTLRSLVDEELKGCLLQYGTFEIALRHVKLNSLSIPKEDFAIFFTVALYEVNCFWIEGVVSDGYKRHGRTSLAAILPVREGGMTLLLQQLLDPLHGVLPAQVLLDSQAFERLNCSFGGALRLQVGLEDVDVVIEPPQILLLDRGNAVENLVGVKHRLGGGEQVGGSGWWFAINEGKSIGSYTKPL
jgi:hypothetical protein